MQGKYGDRTSGDGVEMETDTMGIEWGWGKPVGTDGDGDIFPRAPLQVRPPKLSIPFHLQHHIAHSTKWNREKIYIVNNIAGPSRTQIHGSSQHWSEPQKS